MNKAASTTIYVLGLVAAIFMAATYGYGLVNSTHPVDQKFCSSISSLVDKITCLLRNSDYSSTVLASVPNIPISLPNIDADTVCARGLIIDEKADLRGYLAANSRIKNNQSAKRSGQLVCLLVVIKNHTKNGIDYLSTINLNQLFAGATSMVGLYPSYGDDYYKKFNNGFIQVPRVAVKDTLAVTDETEMAETETVTKTDEDTLASNPLASIDEKGSFLYQFRLLAQGWNTIISSLKTVNSSEQEDSLFQEGKIIVKRADSLLTTVKPKTAKEDSLWQTVKSTYQQKTVLLSKLETAKSSTINKKRRDIYGSKLLTYKLSLDRDVEQGMRGYDVRMLQVILNSDIETRLAETGPGSPGKETDYFGPLTEAAVIKFQEKYAAEILAPSGLALGNGFVGPSTRVKLNRLLPCNKLSMPLDSRIADLQTMADKFCLEGINQEILDRLDILGVKYSLEKQTSGQPVLLEALARTNQYQTIINSQSSANGLPVNMVKSYIISESLGKRWAYNRGSGATGLMQLMYDTAEFVGIGGYNREDPANNIIGGCKYLHYLYCRHPIVSGDYRKTGYGWNYGPNRSQNPYTELSVPRETKDFLTWVMGTWTILNWMDELELGRYQICKTREGDLFLGITAETIRDRENSSFKELETNLRKEYYAGLKEINPFTMVETEQVSRNS